MPNVRLGRKPRKFNSRIPHWSALKMAPTEVMSAPPSKFWEHGMTRDFGMMLNGPDPNNIPGYPDGIGDCVCAHCYHMMQVWTYNANPPEDTEPNSMVLNLYENSCGFDPVDPKSDNGCFMQDSYIWWHNNGIPLSDGTHDKLFGFIEVDPTNLADVRDAIWQCGCVGIGINIPAYLMSGQSVPYTWGFERNGDQNIIGGHAVAMPCYYANGQFGLISWGKYYHMTTAFFRNFVEEVYAPVDLSWIERTGVTPLGLSLTQLEAAMEALKK